MVPCPQEMLSAGGARQLTALFCVGASGDGWAKRALIDKLKLGTGIHRPSLYSFTNSVYY